MEMVVVQCKTTGSDRCCHLQKFTGETFFLAGFSSAHQNSSQKNLIISQWGKKCTYIEFSFEGHWRSWCSLPRRWWYSSVVHINEAPILNTQINKDWKLHTSAVLPSFFSAVVARLLHVWKELCVTFMGRLRSTATIHLCREWHSGLSSNELVSIRRPCVVSGRKPTTNYRKSKNLTGDASPPNKHYVTNLHLCRVLCSKFWGHVYEETCRKAWSHAKRPKIILSKTGF